jgi:glycosyltransferase involved in cell wall biosynthesis
MATSTLTQEDRRPTDRRGFSISAVLPLYNEEALIERSVRRVAEVLGQLVGEFEVVVTDDGSRDRTAEILAGLQATEPALHLRVVSHPDNQGHGAALASGFDAARGDLVLLLDADGQFEVAEVVRLLAGMDEQTDFVIGYRARRADPPLRRLNACGWKLLVNGLFGYTARDVDCALKLFRRQVWQSVSVQSRGATFSAELLIKARRLGCHVKEVPVRHLRRTAGSPAGAHPRVLARALVELFRLRLRLALESTQQVHQPPAASQAARLLGPGRQRQAAGLLGRMEAL